MNFIIDLEFEIRMKDVVNLKVYVVYNWKFYFDEMDFSKVKDEDKVVIVKLVV